MQDGSALRRTPALVVGVVLALAALVGCGSDAGSSAPEATVSSSAAPPPRCPQHAKCFDFGDGTQGWPDDSDDSHYATHDGFEDGSYHVGSRDSGTFHVTAPLDVGALDPARGVRLEVKATTNESFPDSAAWGATCWTRPLRGGKVAGFGVLVQPTQVALGIFDQNTGAFEPLREVDDSDAPRLGKANDLRLTCREDTTGEAPVAVVEVDLNDAAPLAVQVPHGTGRRGWQTADGIGLLAAGIDADVFFDDVRITGLCEQGCPQ